MYVIVIGSAPGESQIVVFSDGSVITIDCTKKKDVNYTLKVMKEMGIENNKVIYNVITHFHDDHIKGVSELISQCPKSKIAIPEAWSNNVFRQFVSAFFPELSLSPANLVTSEVSGIFDIVSAHHGRLVLISERMVLHPSINAGKQRERITILTPTNDRKIKYLAELGKLVEKEEYDKIREFGIKNINATSVSCIIEEMGGIVLLAGDIINNDPLRDVDYITKTYLGDEVSFNFLKMPHHGSETSFSALLRSKLSDDNTIVAITPYPVGRKKLPSEETLAHLKGVKNVWVLCGKRIGMSRSDRVVSKYPFPSLEPIREYIPGIVEYYEGSAIPSNCLGLEEYLKSMRSS